MRLSRPLVLVAVLSQFAQAQGPTTRADSTTLTLSDAIATARTNNPAYLQTANGRRNADAQLRSTYGKLLPSADASFSRRYQQGGQQVFNGLSFQNSSDVLSSGYNIGLNYSINSAALFGPTAARANRDAVDADISGASEMLRSTVTQHYIAVLKAQATAVLQDTLITVAQGQLDLAKAKMAVGSGTLLDIRTAQVALGQAEVAALTAHNNVDVQTVQLYQQMGIPEPTAVKLTTQFAVATPSFTLASVLDQARQQNPDVIALKLRERSAGMTVHMQQAAYTPTLNLSTGWGGQAYEYRDPSFLVAQAQGQTLSARSSCFTNDSIRTRLGLSSVASTCNSYVFTPDMAQSIRDQNNQFPFRFTRTPFQLIASVSLPIFDNFSREQNVEAAEVTRDNARFATKARELQLTADVTQDYLSLVAAARTVTLQQTIADQAREALTFAEERYRVGAATFLDVTTARGTFAQAQINRVNSIYDYHTAFAALESAVGRPLR